MPLKILFVCTANIDRSPTAEALFRDTPGISVSSAGTASDATRPLSAELILWADLIAVMEETHRAAIDARFGSDLAGKQIVCLDIPDDFRRGDAELVALLKTRVPVYLPRD